MTAFIIGMVLAAVAFVLTGCSAAVSAPVTAQNAAWINPGQCPADSPLSAPKGFSSVRVRLPGEPTTAAGYRNLFASIPKSQFGAADLGLTIRMPDKRIVWLFGDTFSTYRFVHSTAVVQTGSKMHVSRGGDQVLPDKSKDVIYWINTARPIDNQTIEIAAEEIVIFDRSNPWGFRATGRDRVAIVKITSENDLTFQRWTGYRKHVAWPTDLTSVGPGHFTYFHRVHGCLPLGGGRWLVTKSQNWDDGKVRPTSAYMILFSEWSN